MDLDWAAGACHLNIGIYKALLYHSYTYVHARMRIHVLTHTYVHKHTSTCTHTYTHKHTRHARMQTQTHHRSAMTKSNASHRG